MFGQAERERWKASQLSAQSQGGPSWVRSPTQPSLSRLTVYTRGGWGSLKTSRAHTTFPPHSPPNTLFLHVAFRGMTARFTSWDRSSQDLSLGNWPQRTEKSPPVEHMLISLVYSANSFKELFFTTSFFCQNYKWIAKYNQALQEHLTKKRK